MKILYVAAKYDYGTPARGFSFEHFNFYETLVGMGHEIVYFDFLSIFQQEGREALGRKLMAAIDEHAPDLMFTFLFTDQFDPEVIRSITRRGRTVTFNWFADDHWRFDTFSRHWAPCFTFVSTTDPRSLAKYHASGCDNVLLTQWGANPRVYPKGSGAVDDVVSFVGQAYGNRPEIIRFLKRHGVPVLTVGARWNVQPWHRMLRKIGAMGEKTFNGIVDSSRVSQEKIVEIFQTSFISLNLSDSSTPGTNQIKGRNFEIPSCGGFQVSGYAERLEEFFEPDKEIVCYRTMDELLKKVKYYLNHREERNAIAEAGYRRTLRDHSYADRFTAIFRQMHLEA